MSSIFPYQRFIILGTARTASTMLWSYLNSHPDILCLRGVFGSKNKINFGRFYNELPEEHYSPSLVELRNKRPIEFLEKYVWKEYPEPFKAIGFKYFYDHNRHLSNKEEVINYFKAEKTIKFLHLKRENLLASLLSYKRALAQQQWTKANTDFQTSITFQECNSYFQNILDHQKQFDGLFPDRILQLKYNDLIKAPEQPLQEVLKFIGVKATSLSSDTSRNRETKLSDCITNYHNLKTHFKNTKHIKYFNE